MKKTLNNAEKNPLSVLMEYKSSFPMSFLTYGVNQLENE